MLRVGSGFDIHRLEFGRQLVLGGVYLDWPKGCAGHSDGDALTHAVIDALLGAAHLGDIGSNFPDNDPAYKDIYSMFLLKETMSKLEREGWKIVNIDCTVILQEPKLGPFKTMMESRLATYMGIDESCISIKAKTAEKMLCELGKGDAVSAMATVLIEKN